MIKCKQDAHDRIADAVYWLSGFASAREDIAGTQAYQMAENLREVQRFIADFSASPKQDTEA